MNSEGCGPGDYVPGGADDIFERALETIYMFENYSSDSRPVGSMVGPDAQAGWGAGGSGPVGGEEWLHSVTSHLITTGHVSLLGN